MRELRRVVPQLAVMHGLSLCRMAGDSVKESVLDARVIGTARARRGFPMRPELVLRGVIPANLMAFDSELEIDEENYRRHLRYLVDTPGVAGITTNAHASEVATLTFEEQQRVLEVTLDEVAGAVPVVSGVYQDGTSKAARIAKSAEWQGADCLLVFPSTVYDFGHQLRPEMAYGRPVMRSRYRGFVRHGWPATHGKDRLGDVERGKGPWLHAFPARTLRRADTGQPGDRRGQERADKRGLGAPLVG